MKKMILFFALSTMLTAQLFINEIDYDQSGDDNNEFLEIAGPAGSYSNVSILFNILHNL